MKRNVICIVIVSAFTAVLAMVVQAAVPPPPANQTIGIPDTTFDNLMEADCRLCHENPDEFPVDPESIPDRHHLLYGQVIPPDSVVPDPDSDGDGVDDTNYACLNCHLEDTSGGVIELQVWRDCLLCHDSSPHHQTAEAQSGDCVHCHGTLVDNPVGCKELQCAVASSSAGATRGVPLGIACTVQGTSGSECDTAGKSGGPVKVCRDTTVLCADDSDCVGIGGETCSSAAYCGMYGDEDICDDGHDIPTYAPSLVTPARSGHGHACEASGTGSVSRDPCTVDEDLLTGDCVATAHTSCNVDADCPGADTCDGGKEYTETCEGADACNYDTDCTEGTCSITTAQTCHTNLDCPSGEVCEGGVECLQTHEEGLAGGCTYCHSADPFNGTVDPGSGILVRDNHDTHHGAGIHRGHSERCAWCHMAGYPHSVYGEEPLHIRWCENCHGYESLHNIAIDSDEECLFGDPACVVEIGGEDPGYSHVGNNDDCWGCHGYVAASAPGGGPAAPYLYGADTMSAVSGYDTTVTLIGGTLTNLVGTYQWTSDISMTGSDGSVVTLTPDSVTSNQIAVTIPADTAPGNYDLRAVKGTSAASNPVVMSVKPEVKITDASCDRKKGVLTLSGSGFGENTPGAESYINVQVDGQTVDITSWTDSRITAAVSKCRGNSLITVNALMGSATSGGTGKPDKPCKGKKCK